MDDRLRASEDSPKARHCTAMRRCGVIMALLLCLMATGCGSKTASLTFASNQGDSRFSQDFTRAYYWRTESGEYDIVLSEDGISPAKVKTSGPIVASAAAALNQTVHIRVLWKPLRGSKPDAPSATNAVIDWYV